MRKTARIRQALRVGVALLALGLFGIETHADDGATPESAAAEAVQRYARESLLQRARDTVDPSRREAGGLDALKQSLAEKRALLQRLDRPHWDELESLLGTWDEATSQGGDGLIQQGAIFFRWMNGQADEVPVIEFNGGPARFEEIDGKPVLKPWRADEEDIPTEVLIGAKADVARRPDKQIALKDVDGLRVVAEPLSKLALTRSDEMSSRYCRTYVEARGRQVAPRVAAFRADVPAAGLVSAGTVRTKTERATVLRGRVDRVRAHQEGVIAALDRLAKEERELRRAAGTRGFDIEEAKRAAEAAAKKRAEAEQEAERVAKAEAPEAGSEEDPGKDEEKPEGGDGGEEADAPKADAPRVLDETEETLEKLRLQEIVDAQRLRLLYVAVRRADLRGRLLAQVLNQVKEEAVAAEDAQQRYEIELARMRRERQMDRLAYEESSLTLAHTEAHKNATESAEAARPVWTAYDAALEALMTLNKATMDAVGMRRTLETRTQPADRAALAVRDEQGCLPPPGDVPPDAPTPEKAPDHDPLQRFHNPRSESLDATYVTDAMGFLDDPGWSRQMTAAHYEAVDDRIEALRDAGAIIQRAAELEQRFALALTAAEAALAQVETLGRSAPESRRWPSRLRDAREEWLDPNVKAFNETLRSIKDEAEQVRADIVVYERFRERLLHLGTRSFGVRVQRQLDSDKLGAAYDDLAATIRKAGRWLTFQDGQHLGTFVKGHWLMLLACVGVLVGSVFLVQVGRRGLDRRLRSMAKGVQQLRAEPVTVRAEEAQAEREAAQSEAVARAAEEAALREVSKDEAAKAQRTGEGGYGGEGA